MFKLKNSKRKSRSNSQISNDDRSSSTTSSPRNNLLLDENQVRLLSNWLDQLNKEKLITLTDQHDIVIMAGGVSDHAQQIFVHSDDIDSYMERKMFYVKTNDQPEMISMSDLARILLQFGYVTESSGQLSFPAHRITLDTNELKWLRSIVYDARPDSKSFVTHVKLFDGENTQLISIPYEYLQPTNDRQIVGNYLFQNGFVRYDVQRGTYAYRYVEPDLLLDDKTKSPERIRQHQFLSFHLRYIHIDQTNKSIQLEFCSQPNENLLLPSRWYDQIFDHHFDRDYIIDILLANGGVVTANTFVFMGRTYSLKTSTDFQQLNLSSKEKSDLIRQYIELIIQMDGVKKDEMNQLFVLENDADGRKLYFTPEHSKLIEQNQFQREDVIQILMNYSQIKQDQYKKYYLNYNHQFIRLPSSICSLVNNQKHLIHSQQIFQSNEKDFIQRYDQIIDYMCRHGLVTWDRSSNLIKLHFADQTLLLPMNHLRSIINSSALKTNSLLPFTSRQLSQWLRNNSYITRTNLKVIR